VQLSIMVYYTLQKYMPKEQSISHRLLEQQSQGVLATQRVIIDALVALIRTQDSTERAEVLAHCLATTAPNGAIAPLHDLTLAHVLLQYDSIRLQQRSRTSREYDPLDEYITSKALSTPEMQALKQIAAILRVTYEVLKGLETMRVPVSHAGSEASELVAAVYYPVLGTLSNHIEQTTTADIGKILAQLHSTSSS
jgi:hypothetical protein